MPERLRARYGAQTVTVLDKRLKKTGKTRIRDAHGFTKEVPSKDLTAIPDGEPGAKLRFGDSAD